MNVNNDKPQQETHQEWLLRSSLEAETAADKNGTCGCRFFMFSNSV